MNISLGDTRAKLRGENVFKTHDWNENRRQMVMEVVLVTDYVTDSLSGSTKSGRD